MRHRAMFLLTTTVLAIPAVLACDAHASAVQQLALGFAVALLFVWHLQGATRDERAIALTCVLVSTVAELFNTEVWGLYAYRLGTVPFYVPFGHGVLCLAALATAKVPAVQRRRRAIVAATTAIALAWSAAGLFFGRDVEGALYLPIFLPLLLLSNRGIEYSVTFALASIVEIGGTYFANWEWAPVQPWIGVTSANPPSGAAGGYCTFLLASIALVWAFRRARRVFAIAIA